jgi:hypothetical protein
MVSASVRPRVLDRAAARAEHEARRAAKARRGLHQRVELGDEGAGLMADLDVLHEDRLHLLVLGRRFGLKETEEVLPEALGEEFLQRLLGNDLEELLGE